MQNNTFQRKQSYKESFFSKAYEIMPSAFSVVCGIKIDIAIESSTIEQALRIIIEETQSLRFKMVSLNQELYFEELLSAELCLPISYENCSTQLDYDKLIEQWCDTAINTNTWLWHLKIYKTVEKQSFLLFYFHHSITDGQYAFTLISKLLNTYKALIENKTHQKQNTYNFPMLLNRKEEKLSNSPKVFINHADEVKLYSQVHSKMFTFSLNAQICDQLRANCKDNKTCLNDILVGSVVQSLKKIFGKSLASDIAINIPYSTRNLDKPEINSDGFSCRYVTYHNSKEIDLVYDHAKHYNAILPKLKALNDDYLLGTFDQEKSAAEVNTLIHNITQSKLEAAITLSNIGYVSFGKWWDDKISYICLNSGRKACDQLLLIEAIKFNKGLYVSVSYPAPAVDSTDIENFTRTLEDELLNLSQRN